MQILVDNAIQHGIAPTKKPGKIVVKFEIVNNVLICAVEDNGMGRDVSKQNKDEKSDHTSMGTELIEDSLAWIKKKTGVGSLRFEDLHDSNEVPVGTKAILTLPIVK
mgnify:FL=1